MASWLGAWALEPTAWILIPALQSTTYGTLCRLLNLSVSQLSYMSNGGSNGNCFTGLLALNELIPMQHLEQCLAYQNCSLRVSCFLSDSLPSRDPFFLPHSLPSPSLPGLSSLPAVSSISCPLRSPDRSGFPLSSLPTPRSLSKELAAGRWGDALGAVHLEPAKDAHSPPNSPTLKSFSFSCLKWRDGQGLGRP